MVLLGMMGRQTRRPTLSRLREESFLKEKKQKQTKTNV